MGRSATRNKKIKTLSVKQPGSLSKADSAKCLFKTKWGNLRLGHPVVLRERADKKQDDNDIYL